MAGYAQWSSFTTYVVNDIVAFDGVLYIALQISTNRQPNSNPTFWATTGASSAITSIVAGSGISVSGTTAITVTNAGVRTLTAGANMTIGGTATDPTVINNGVRSITAGTGITIAGTANVPIIENAMAIGRNPSIISLNPPPVGGIVAGMSTPLFRGNVVNYSLTSAFPSCNVFTLYIRNITLTGNCFTTGPPVSTPVTLYVSDSPTGAYDPTLGAIASFVFTINETTSTVTASNLIWNVRKNPSANLYLNVQNTTSTLCAILTFQIDFDLVGQLATLI
jgi:hypothetical protein